MDKDAQSENKPFTSIESMLSSTRFGLENLHLFNGTNRPIQVRELDIANNSTIVCGFYPYARNSADVKIEISAIMGFFHGFLGDDKTMNFKYCGVKAYDKEEQLIMYALSSKGAVQSIGEGDSLDWLKGTLFQDNTNDYRLSMAKKLISEIENSLRHIITDVLAAQFQNDWWNKALDSKLGKSVKETYLNQFGVESSDGNILINYTFTIQLKKIITTYWSHFSHLFGSKIEFENSMDELNVIRREEAHNRTITADHLESLKKMYFIILSKALNIYINIVPTYLIENWRLQVGLIMGDKYEPLYKSFELTDEPDPQQKLSKSVQSTLHLISYLTDVIQKLTSVVTPVQKQQIHDELLDRYKKYNELQKEKITLVETKKWNEVEGIIRIIENNETELKAFVSRFLSSEG